MATKRTIRGTQYNIGQIVDDAIAAVEGMALDTDKARKSLQFMGHQNPSDELVIRYAREAAILKHMQRATGAAFDRQIGNISFESREATIKGVESYLNRRNAGNRARWTESHR